MGRVLIVHAADNTALPRVGVVDRGDGLMPPCERQFFRAENSRKKTTPVAQALPSDEFEAGKR